MAKRRSNDGGMVFSTNSSFSWDDDTDLDDDNWSPSDCKLYVSLDRKQRAGKPVSIVEGHDGPPSELLTLGKDLKKMCGVGGTVKEGCILIQGDHRDKIVLHLEKLGYSVKRKGG
jgi:translation initiation factor 1